MARSKKTINSTTLYAVVLTVVAILAWEFIPKRTYSLVPHFGEWRNQLILPYSEDLAQAARWIDREGFHFACKRQDDPRWQLCGADIYYSDAISIGDDLSGYSSLIIDAEFSGDASHVRVCMRNYNAQYSNPRDANSAKFLQLNLETREFNNGVVVIGLEEFDVAEWWKAQRSLHRSLTPPEFGNITTIGFDFSAYFEHTEELEFNVREIYLSGDWISKDNWYLGILMFWLVAISAAVLYRYIALLRRSRAYNTVINDLVTDKAQLDQQSQELQALSQLDRLTGAFNRMGIENSYKRIVSGQKSKFVGLIVIDIDHFKRINDHRGHDAGDEVLKDVVERIQRSIRDHDVLGRWGGEEFILLTPNIGVDNVYGIAEKLRTAIADKEFMPEKPLQVTASFGVAVIHPDEDLQEAFKRADEALYKAKAQGRNCTVLADAYRG